MKDLINTNAADPRVNSYPITSAFPKPVESLIAQVSRVSMQVGGESVIPRTLANRLHSSDLMSIKAEHPVRYATYRHLLRKESAPDGPGDGLDEGRMVKTLRQLNNLDKYIENYQNGSDQTLRPLQMDVLSRLREALERGELSGYVKLPTGSGKTVIFSEFLEALGGKSLVVVPTNQLVKQTVDSLKRFAPGKMVSTYNGNSKDLTGDTVVITYDSLLLSYDRGELRPEDFDAVILDEAHRALGDRRTEIIENFKAECITVGFTATPEFNDEKAARVLLGEPYYEMSLKQAVEHGLLCPARSVLVTTDADLSKIHVSSDGSVNEQDLERAINKESTNQAAVKVYQEYFAGKTGVAFCAGVDHSREMAEKFCQAGVAAATWGGDPDLEQKLADLKSGKIKMLCNAKLLIEGFDECGISVCLNLAPTTSIVNAEQRGGRVMRLNELDPFKQAFIVDFIPEVLPPNFAPVTFAEVMGGTALGVVGKLPVEEKASTTEGSKTSLPKIEGVDVLLNSVEIMSILDRQGWQKAAENAPDGWRQVHELHSFFPELSPAAVPQIIKEWVRNVPKSEEHLYLAKYPGGKLSNIVDHVSPALITELQATLRQLPEGWSLFRSLELDGLPQSKTQSILFKLIQDGVCSEVPSRLLDDKILIISPELVLAAQQEARSLVRPPPVGWSSLSSVQENNPGLERRVIRAALQLAGNTRPEDSGLFTDPATGEAVPFYSSSIVSALPQLLRVLRIERETTKDWLTIHELSKATGNQNANIIANSIDPNRELHRKLPFRGPNMFYDPKIVEMIISSSKQKLHERNGTNEATTRVKVNEKYHNIGETLKRGKAVRELVQEFPEDIKFRMGKPGQDIIVTKEGAELLKQKMDILALELDGNIEVSGSDVQGSVEQSILSALESGEYAAHVHRMQLNDRTVLLLGRPLRAEFNRRLAKAKPEVFSCVEFKFFC